MRTLHVLSTLALLTAPASALDVVFVSDSNGDKIWRCEDLNSNGTYNDPSETTIWYDDTIGPFALSVGTGIRSGPDGTVYVCDSTEHYVLAMRDYNNDGDANDDGESWLFFDGRAGGNLSGVIMTSAQGLYYDAATRYWWIASANTSSGNDAILRVRDNDLDGNANGAGEAIEYYVEPTPAGSYLPNGVTVGLDGKVYFVENGTLAGAKGIYKLDDLDNSGFIDQPNEKTFFFSPPAQANTAFFWALERDMYGAFYLADTGNDIIWRAYDADSSGAINGSEASIYWTSPSASMVWDTALAPDGSIYCAESQTPDRILRLLDANSDGVVSAAETTEVYSNIAGAGFIGDPRSIDLVGAQAPGVPFCFGDNGNCPCANIGTAGKGCPSSIFPGGARLEADGVASVGGDSVALVGTRMPNSSVLYFQGTAQLNGGSGLAFGDGLRCVGGSVIRLGTKTNVNGASRYPESGDLTVSVRGMAAPSDTRFYQAWYRNAAAFCNPETFNLTNGVRVVWAP